VLQYHQRSLVDLIHSQMLQHYRERAVAYEAQVTKGFVTLRPNPYSAPKGEPPRNFRTTVDDRLMIRGMLFGGFKKCLYPVQKFDTDSERRFAVILEQPNNDVLKWFKPAKTDFQIFYRGDNSYEPDFVVETETMKYLCEPKRASEMTDETVSAKAAAAVVWCKHASDHAKQHGAKPWAYLLIPHDAITDSKTLKGLAAAYTRK